MKRCAAISSRALLAAVALGLTAQAGAQELVACSVPAISGTAIVPSTPVSTAKCSTSVEISAAVGEYEPASFVLRSPQDIPGLNITTSTLDSEAKSIPVKNISVRYVKAWYQGGNAWSTIRQDGKRRLVPELLLNDETLIKVDDQAQANSAKVGNPSRYVDISSSAEKGQPAITPISSFPIADAGSTQPINLRKNSTQQIWITVHVPDDALPGAYKGNIQLRSPTLNKDIPFQVNVRPLVLAPPDLTYSIYYRGILTPDNRGSISSEDKTTDQLYAELVNMHEHGISNSNIYQPSSDNTALFKQVLELRKKAGMDNTTLYYLGITTGNYNDEGDLNRRYRQFGLFKTVAQNFGTKSFNIYGVDEAEFSAISKQQNVWQQFRKRGAEIFAADWKAGVEKHYSGKLPLLINGVTPNAQVNSTLQNAGTRAFMYNQPQIGVENPQTYRSQYGLVAWQKGYDGVMDYAYQHSFGDIWNDFDHPGFRDHVFAYPTADGVIDTIAWEGFREAVDDVRYLSTLRALATQFNSSDDLNYLQTLKGSPQTDLEKVRSEISDRIENLCSKRGTTTTGAAGYCRASSPSKINDLKINVIK